MEIIRYITKLYLKMFNDGEMSIFLLMECSKEEEEEVYNAESYNIPIKIIIPDITNESRK